MFANRANPDQAAPDHDLHCLWNMIIYDPTLVYLKSNFFVQCKNVKVYLYKYSQWVELTMDIHEGKGQIGKHTR